MIKNSDFFFFPTRGHFFSLLPERNRQRVREKERERNTDVREKHQLVAFSYAPRRD